jgi:hypothetical protein
MLSTKPTVRFRVITPALVRMQSALLLAARILPDLPAEGLVITSGTDGQHSPNSRHYVGEALDLRSKSFSSVAARAAFIGSLGQLLGPQFTVLLEDDGRPNEHIHCQVRKGHRFDETQP